ncbi:MAG: T9SS type A sorting domain-containing protein [Bacteroidia bacterium]|nr:T9SS type A sorting domain-containing protein [Bacteroidia bacterium]
MLRIVFSTDSLFTSALQSIILPAVGDTVYVRLKKGLPIGNISDETTKVSITSADFISKYFQFVGSTIAASAVKNGTFENLKFITANGSINVIGIKAGKQIEIYNTLGQKVKSVTASENTLIPLANKGIYLIKVDAFVQKVVLK